MSKINCFLIGVQKGGTSTFFNWLGQHPEVDAPEELKDVNFFMDGHFEDKDEHWLESYYKKKSKVKIQGAVNYIYSKDAPEHIHAYNPEAKFLLILRDPVKRAFSAYQYFNKLGLELRSFEDAIDGELSSKITSPEDLKNFTYIGHGMYAEQLSNWFKFFSPERFKILFYEEVFKQPQNYLNEVYAFLGIEEYTHTDLNSKNVTGSVKYSSLNKVLLRKNKVKTFANKYLLLRYLVPFKYRVKFVNWLRDWNTDPNKNGLKLSKEQYIQLNSHFVESNKQLSQFTSKDLNTFWNF